MQTKPFTTHEVYLPRDVPEVVVSKASHTSASTPPQKGQQNKWNRTPQYFGTETAPSYLNE